jgi:hypothetical protein
MNVSPKESTDRGGHVGPSLSQVVDRPHFGAKSPLPWWVHVLGGGIGSTNLMKSVWQRNMATQPCGDHLAVLCYRIVAAKPRNCLWDAINTPPPMLSTTIHTLYSRFSTCKGSGALVVA